MIFDDFLDLWLPFDSLWHPFGSLWLPFGSLWLPFGFPWLPFGSLWVVITHSKKKRAYMENTSDVSMPFYSQIIRVDHVPF
jgi:hypothetical protein